MPCKVRVAAFFAAPGCLSRLFTELGQRAWEEWVCDGSGANPEPCDRESASSIEIRVSNSLPSLPTLTLGRGLKPYTKPGGSKGRDQGEVVRLPLQTDFDRVEGVFDVFADDAGGPGATA